MTFQLSEEFLWKEIGDQVVVLHFESGRYYSLNCSGAVIWKGLLENQSPDQIASSLCEGFAVDESTAREDIEKMTSEFLKKKFIIAS
jgi:hypothetical protein